MNINLSSILKRLTMGATVAAGVVATQCQATGQIPHTLTALVPALVIGTLSAFPAGSAPAGLLTPKAPGQPSVADQVIGGVQALLSAPKNQSSNQSSSQQAALGRAEVEQIAMNVTMNLLAQQLAKAAPPPAPPATITAPGGNANANP